MKKISIAAFCTILSLVSFSCIPVKYITNVTDGGGIEKPKNKTILVIGLDNLHINDYQKTFDKNYSSKEEYIDNLTNVFYNKLNSSSIFNEVLVDTSDEWNHMSSLTSRESFDKIDALFKKTKTDYVVCFSETTIEQKMKSNHIGTEHPFDDDDESTRSENVVVQTKVIVYDVNTSKPVLQYDVFGETSVMLFNYSYSLEEATSNMVDNAIKYHQ
tara:strand:+ start:24666 stop:25310 length:645 start_codon:yes stop_codon:yes gene_type:complete